MKKLAIFGTSGFAKELLDLAIDQGYKDILFLEKDQVSEKTLLGWPVVSESQIPSFKNTVYAIGVADPKIRKKIYDTYPSLIYPNLIHSQASLGYQIKNTLQLRKGLVIAAGARVTNSCQFGNFIIVSFNSTIGHDCILNDYVSVMPGANISGCVHLQDGVYIGTNAAVLPGKNPDHLKILGANSVIGAGALVVENTLPNKIYVGTPAKELNCD